MRLATPGSAALASTALVSTALTRRTVRPEWNSIDCRAIRAERWSMRAGLVVAVVVIVIRSICGFCARFRDAVTCDKRRIATVSHWVIRWALTRAGEPGGGCSVLLLESVSLGAQKLDCLLRRFVHCSTEACVASLCHG